MTMTLEQAIAPTAWMGPGGYFTTDPRQAKAHATNGTQLTPLYSGDLIPKADAGADLEHGLQTPQPGEVPASSAPALIPKADAEMAVVLAYQRAATEADARYAAGDMGNPGHHILALAPADALAEVQALKAERDQLEQDLADMRDNADSAFRRGYYAGRNGE